VTIDDRFRSRRLPSLCARLLLSASVTARKKRAARRRGSGGGEAALTYADLEHALEGRDPRFADLVVRYLAQPDPPENVPEGPPPEDPPELPDDAWTVQRLRGALAEHNFYGKSPAEEWAMRRAAWRALLEGAEHPPPRLRLGDLAIELYESGDAWARQALISIFSRARLGWGLWKGFKTLFKLAEVRHDAEMFGVLAWRLDASMPVGGEVSAATIVYLRRRAWRYLRQLGTALPELYPSFCVEVLRHFQRGVSFRGSWVANQIWGHADLVGERVAHFDRPPADLSRRAFDEAWKQTPEPLFRLFELADNDLVCQFAARSLSSDFASALRRLPPAWLARVGGKGLASADEFVVEQLEKNPELHRSKLAGLGLHDMVVGLLHSSSERAVRYAIDYCNAHAPAIPLDDLLALAEERSGVEALVQFVAARLEKTPDAEIGLGRLIRMLAIAPLAELAAAKLGRSFRPADLDEAAYVALATGTSAQQKFVESFYESRGEKVPSRFLVARAEHPGLPRLALRAVMGQLEKRTAASIGVAWIQEALLDERFSSYVSQWLRAGMLRGDELDVGWLQGLVARPSWRSLALEILGNTDLVAPHRIGSEYLLRAARHSDERVSEFAHRYLLQHFTPLDFAREQGSEDVGAGIDRIWSLLGSEQPAAVRRFAATYLRVHHPDLSAAQDESVELGIAPRIPREAYTIERVSPLLFEARADVRELAAAIARVELLRWNAPALAYAMASSRYREPRAVGAEALLGIGSPPGSGALAPPESWLQPAAAFAMAESSIKATREIALTLIRRHYEVLGSPELLARLMDSPDREVRLFAVRLLWDRHRPGAGDGAFKSEDALRQFVRTVMFGLPPGRMERRDTLAVGGPERPLASSVAKRRLIAVVRDLAVEDRDFAGAMLPVLEEFLASAALMEWQGCVAAVAWIRRAHPGLETALPPALDIEAAPAPALAAVSEEGAGG
jgi:hypothetical protein